MGLFDVLSSILYSAAKSTADKRASVAKDFDRSHPGMSSETREKLDKWNQDTEKLSSTFGTSVRTSSESRTSEPTTYMGKTISEWDCEWQSIGMLRDADLSAYNSCVGLYRHVIDGKTMYVGRAVELHNGGFRKRLSDYRRDSDSARKHQSGKTIHQHLDEIETYILVVGDTDEAVCVTKQLEGPFVRRYNPPWNKQINI